MKTFTGFAVGIWLGLLSSGAEEVQETILANGLKVLTKEAHAAPVVTVQVIYKVGSRNEAPGISGLSHQLEHLMFKGTQKLGAGEIDRLLSLAGGENNAFTTEDLTAYHETLPASGLETALTIEADRMVNSRMSDADMKTERHVVLSELDGDDNSPTMTLDENVKSSAFKAHPYQWPVIGFRTDVVATTAAQVQRYYHTYYQPNNAVLVVVGDFETKTTLQKIHRLFDHIPRGPEPPLVITSEPPQRGEKRVTVKGSSGVRYGEILYHVPAIGHPDESALDVLDTILTSGDSSRLYRAMVETQTVTDISSDLALKRDPGWYAFYLTLPDGVTEAVAEKKLYMALDEIKRQGITDPELQKAKNQAKAAFVFHQETVTELATALGSAEAEHSWHDFTDYVAKVEKVTAAEVQRVATTYLQEDNRTVGWFLPQKRKAGEAEVISAPAPSGHGSDHHAPDLSAAKFSRPAKSPLLEGTTDFTQALDLTAKVKRTVLPNGLTLLLYENHATPTITLSGYYLAGGVLDPQDKPGLAALTANTLIRGSAHFSNEEIADQLDFVGASLSFSAGDEFAQIEGKALKEHFPLVLNLMQDCLRAPTFPAEEFDQLAKRLATTYQEALEDPATRASEQLSQLLYPEGHPLRTDIHHEQAALKLIHRDDCVAFHRRYARPDTMVLVIVGDFEADAMRAQIEKALGDWKPPADSAPNKFTNALPAITGQPKTISSLPDKSEVIVKLGARGIRREAPDYFAALLANEILGGNDFGALLMKTLRDQQGLTYGIGSGFHGSRGEMPWTLHFQTAPENVDKALASIHAVIEQFQAGKFTDDDIARIKASQIGGVILSLESNDGIAGSLMSNEYHQRGQDYLARFATAIRNATRTDILQAAQKYIPRDHFVTSIAGPYPLKGKEK